MKLNNIYGPVHLDALLGAGRKYAALTRVLVILRHHAHGNLPASMHHALGLRNPIGSPITLMVEEIAH